MRVLFAGPYDTKGRYRGGISYIVNTVYERKNSEVLEDVELETFNTCKVNRSKSGQGRFTLQNLKNTLEILRDLKMATKQKKADVIYYNSSYGVALLKDLLTIQISGCRSHMKVIVHIHFADYENILPTNALLNRITFNLMKNSVDHLVFLSDNSRKRFVEKGIPSSKTSVIYNFHNIKMSKIELENKMQTNESSDVLNLIYLGSIDRRKGIIDLLKALQMVEIKYHLSVCGEAVDVQVREDIDNILCNLPEGTIDFRGYVTGDVKDKLLFQSDVLVLPSYGEGFPIVLLEGIATANCIITTSVGAIPEVFGSKNGVMIEPGDIKGLAKAITEYANPEKRKETMQFNYFQSKKFEINNYLVSLKKVCKSVGK